MLFIDSQKNKDDISATIAELTFDTGAIDSQVEVLKSEKVALSVISTMHLTSDPEFMGARSTLIGRTLAVLRSMFDFNSWFVKQDKADPDKSWSLSALRLTNSEQSCGSPRWPHLCASRGLYVSRSQEAAAIANAFTEAYLIEQLDSKYEATRRASGWLQARITELKQKSLAADFAIQKFKADNGLVTADGKLVTDQQLTELNTQLARRTQIRQRQSRATPKLCKW